MSVEVSSHTEVREPKHEAILEAAVGVFARYGFRKASMDEVARAAGVSRQGLYLLFADKEALFQRAVSYKLEQQLSAARTALADPLMPLEDRLVAACDAWGGRYVELAGGNAADLMCASSAIAGATLGHYQSEFQNALVAALDASPLANFCSGSGLSTADAARALHATVQGLKQSCTTRREFVQAISAAARLFCAALTRPILLEDRYSG